MGDALEIVDDPADFPCVVAGAFTPTPVAARVWTVCLPHGGNFEHDGKRYFLLPGSTYWTEDDGELPGWFQAGISAGVLVAVQSEATRKAK